MLAVSPLNYSTFGWEFPIAPVKEHQALGAANKNTDASFVSQNHPQHDHCDHNRNRDHHHVPNFPASPAKCEPYQNEDHDHQCHVEGVESPQSASSAHQKGPSVLARRLNHNASERDRRKKINSLYASLRALLPAADQMKDLSIPATVARVLKYIPELQKELENLNYKKEELLSNISLLQGVAGAFSQEEKPRTGKYIKERSFSSVNISVNKMGERELIIQISAYQRIPLPEMLLLLERNYGLLVIDVSSSQSFGGRTFYNLHLWMEGTIIFKYEMLNEELRCLIEKHAQAGVLLQEEEPKKVFEFWHHRSQILCFK